MSTTDIVQKLWGLCHVLRDDGVTYQQYVTELTYLLFLKMMKETEQEHRLPKGYRWGDLEAAEGIAQLTLYRTLLLKLGTEPTGLVQQIYVNAATSIKEPRTLAKLVEAIDALDWYSAKSEGLGDLYEGLLQRNAGEVKSGAGQYFTPRPLIDSIVALVQPKAGEIVQDPAAGTAGFLIAADAYVKAQTDGLFDLSDKQQKFQREQAFAGIELVQETHRLSLMNLMLHDIHGGLEQGDSLSPLGAALPKADVILSNPPFGTKMGGGLPTRDDFTYRTSNKQLSFLQHIYRGLKAGGRAAVVLPDNVLFEDGVGADIRRDLMDKTDLHTVLRLPTGIFYAQGVKTNVLFFSRGAKDVGTTKDVWIYDARTNAPSFGKRTPLTRGYFAAFEKAFGGDPLGKAKRKDEGEGGRWRKFSRGEIAKRGDNLDVTWLRDESVTDSADLAEPEVIAAEIVGLLKVALEEMEGLAEELGS